MRRVAVVLTAGPLDGFGVVKDSAPGRWSVQFALFGFSVRLSFFRGVPA